jgi:hypothetical protein
MKYRILKNENGLYQVQFKQKLRWRRVYGSALDTFNFKTFDKAMDAAKDHADEHRRTERANRWKVHKEIEL